MRACPAERRAVRSARIASTAPLRVRRYVERRTREGRSKREIIRSLKRYVARQLYRHLPRAESLA